MPPPAPLFAHRPPPRGLLPGVSLDTGIEEVVGVATVLLHWWIATLRLWPPYVFYVTITVSSVASNSQWHKPAAVQPRLSQAQQQTAACSSVQLAVASYSQLMEGQDITPP